MGRWLHGESWDVNNVNNANTSEMIVPSGWTKPGGLATKQWLRCHTCDTKRPRSVNDLMWWLSETMCISASQEPRGGSMAVIRIGVSLDGCFFSSDSPSPQHLRWHFLHGDARNRQGRQELEITWACSSCCSCTKAMYFCSSHNHGVEFDSAPCLSSKSTELMISEPRKGLTVLPFPYSCLYTVYTHL